MISVKSFVDFITTFPDSVTNTVFTSSFPRFSMTSLIDTGTSQFCVHVMYKLFLSMFIFLIWTVCVK